MNTIKKKKKRKEKEIIHTHTYIYILCGGLKRIKQTNEVVHQYRVILLHIRCHVHCKCLYKLPIEAKHANNYNKVYMVGTGRVARVNIKWRRCIKARFSRVRD